MKWLILILSAILLFYNLGTNRLGNWDEAWYASVSRHMALSNDFIQPIWNTKPFFEKPPLYYWTSAITMKIVGSNEWGARIPSALAALATIWLVYLLTKLLFKNENMALSSMLVLISTIGFIYRARTGNMDNFLAFWLLLTIYGYFRLPERKGIAIFVLGIVGAFLTKGLIAFAFPLVVIGWGLINYKKKYLTKVFVQGLIYAAFICMLWFLGSYYLFGRDFLNQFLTQQGEKLGLSSLIRNFSLDYFVYLYRGMKLWTFLAVPGVIYLLIVTRKQKAILIPLYFLILFGAYSFMSLKSDWYLVPLYPLLAISASFFVWDMKDKLRIKKYDWLILTTIFIISVFQLYNFRSQYITPDISGDEARVALAAKDATRSGDTIYLTNYYYPTTEFYSQRRVIAVYSEQAQNASWWVKAKTDWPVIVKENPLYIITTREEWGFLQDHLPKDKFKILFQSGEKLLITNI